MKSIIILFAVLLATGCRHATEPPPPVHVSSVLLTVEDALCTEVWLKLAFTDTSGARNFAVFRTGGSGTNQTLFTGRLIAKDTTLVDTTAQPASKYTYAAYRLNGNTLVDWSSDLSVTTMPTTSHNFNWQIDTLGSGNSSYLKDVAIIDDNNIWAVGEIYLSGETTRYNAAVFNGSTWSIQRVPYYYQGQPVYNPIQTVFAFAANDIWFAGNGVIHWNGQQFVAMTIPLLVWGPYQINRIWGTSGSNLFIVGDGGSIARYDGSSWQKIESGTTLDIVDVWGNGDEVIAVGSKLLTNLDRRILKINENTVATLSDSSIQQPLSCVWFSSSKQYYVAGSGIYTKHSLLEDIWKGAASIVSQYYIFGMRGNAVNDIVAVGGLGECLHFDGVSWRSYQSNTGLYGNYEAVAIRNNLVVAVGAIGAEAVVAIGTRN